MKQVGHLENLELITVSKNQIVSIPHTLSNLAELNTLEIQDNKIWYTPEDPLLKFTETTLLTNPKLHYLF